MPGLSCRLRRSTQHSRSRLIPSAFRERITLQGCIQFDLNRAVFSSNSVSRANLGLKFLHLTLERVLRRPIESTAEIEQVGPGTGCVVDT
jgi:hypothetical protein